MNESNDQFAPYSQNLYQQQAPSAPQPEPEAYDPPRISLMGALLSLAAQKMRSPLVATVSLFVIGAAFAGVIAFSYPQGGSSGIDNLPVIKADLAEYKTRPDEPGGMDVPHQDSTIFNVIRPETATNLLEDANASLPSSPAPQTDEFVSSQGIDQLQQSPARTVENLLDPAPLPAEPSGDQLADVSTPEQPAPVPTADITEPAVSFIADAPIAPEAATPPQDVAEVGTAPVTTEGTQAAETKPGAVVIPQKRPSNLHAAGSSPETLAFVRSVLDEKDPRKVAEAMESINPASGGQQATTRTTSAGGYYVQLGSVSSPTGAEREWNLIRQSFMSDLQGFSHRVQEANLGAKGTYYRIQAGPMSKDQASSVCQSIKSKKPGACLVVQ